LEITRDIHSEQSLEERNGRVESGTPVLTNLFTGGNNV
jgi:hypothetical protein